MEIAEGVEGAVIDPKPILVLGVNRSGTKWLSNEISRHPDVAVVAHADHGGIIESNLLTDYALGFDFSSAQGYDSFLDFWTRTDFFVYAGAHREAFEPPNPRPNGPVVAFRQLMDGLARSTQCRWWLQKVSPFSTANVLRQMPDATLVMIRRGLNATVRSRLRLDSDRSFGTTAFRAGFSIALQVRELRRVCKGRDVLVVRYEDMKRDRDSVLDTIFRFLGVSPSPLGDHAFPRNTSFPSEGDRAASFGLIDRIYVGVAWLLVNSLPYFLLKRTRRGMTRARLEPLPGTFRHEEKISRGS